jgi:molybdopterin-containing oxidoreductase family iron-sulfur binding subunit
MTACGAKPLHQVPKERLRAQLRDLEREYSKTYGTAVTVADTPAMPGVLFAYALDISRCIGCRRCV